MDGETMYLVCTVLVFLLYSTRWTPPIACHLQQQYGETMYLVPLIVYLLKGTRPRTETLELKHALRPAELHRRVPGRR